MGTVCVCVLGGDCGVYLMVEALRLSPTCTRLYVCHISSASSGISVTWLSNTITTQNDLIIDHNNIVKSFGLSRISSTVFTIDMHYIGCCLLQGLFMS